MKALVATIYLLGFILNFLEFYDEPSYHFSKNNKLGKSKETAMLLLQKMAT